MKALIILSIVIFIFSCSESTTEGNPDNIPPSVSIISPSDGTIVSGIIDIICISTDNESVKKVELWIDGVFSDSLDEQEPFIFNFNTEILSDGVHTLTARSFDDGDNKNDSDPISVNVLNTISLDNQMILIPGGIFTMGDTWAGTHSDEIPTHDVLLDTFYISKFEITQSQWLEIMGSNPSNITGDGLPVERVTWLEVIEFCNQLSSENGLSMCYTINGQDVSWNKSATGFRLPTEAEWEFAARGGLLEQSTIFAGSNDPENVAWFSSNSANTIHTVGQKLPNELGLYDMSGNVWEFVWDWKGLYESTLQINPTGPVSGTDKVVRGGAYYEGEDRIRVSERGTELIDSRGGSDHIGFRIVRSW